VSVAVTGLCLAAADIPAAAQKLLQFLLENRFDRGADVQAKPILNRVITTSLASSADVDVAVFFVMA